MPEYRWYCDHCVQALRTWQQVTEHKARGHAVSDYIWPPPILREVERQ